MRYSALFLLIVTPSLAAQDFQRDVAPILIGRCLECHSGLQPKGKLDLSSAAAVAKGGKSGAAVVAGDLDASELWVRVDAGQMPPKKPLSDAEKKVLRNWIAHGARWSGGPLDLFSRSTEHRAGYDWWSLKPINRPQPPQIKSPKAPRNPIDFFVIRQLEEKGLQLHAEADRRTLIRRLSFDLLGLPPTPEQVEKFSNDDRPDAYEKLVDELLQSPHHGERWARHWLDVVRFAESHGFEHDELRKNAWPYRDWVIAAFNKDVPYDEFVRLQIAGDVLRPDDAGAAAATGFLVAGGFDSVGQRQQSVAMKAVVRQDELEDIIGAVGQTFLGLTVHCARCHDHKFDPIRQSEYYRLAAALAGVRHGERDLPATALAKEFAKAQEELSAINAKARQEILAKNTSKKNDSVLPLPLARWDFTKSLDDQVGALHVKLRNGAERTSAGLVLDGLAYANTPALARPVRARTFSVWVKLANLEQRGGAAMSLQKLDGSVFDAVVFGEKEPRRWLAGSDFFRRSTVFGGPEESAASRQPVHLALVYAEDGSITAFRNGQPYGKSIRPPGPVTYAAGEAQILFGLRHSPAGGNKHLFGVISQAEFFDRALTEADVAALTAQSAQYISEEILLQALSPAERERRADLVKQIAVFQAKGAAPGKAYMVAPQAPEATFVLLRGEPSRKGDEVSPGAVRAVGKADFGLAVAASDAERRRKLAEWLTSADNPLLARVMVNRLWHYHFGAGIVETPSDFGFNGGRPSHPELLDWLADEFRRHGWSMKHMHRLIVTSATYRQASTFNVAAAKVDASNRLLWRKTPMRLEAEAARDAILSVAGKLNPKMHGPGYQDFKLIIRGATHYYPAHDADSDENYRRSIYRTWVRSGRNPLLDTLDCPDPSTVTPRRAVTTTPLQSLSLLNSEFMLRMSDYFAQRIEREAGADINDQIAHAYRLAFGRALAHDEAAAIRSVVEQHGLAVLCRVIFNSNEFMYVD